jgi:hypothetical protein
MVPMDTVCVGYEMLQALNDGDCKRAKYEHDTETERRKREAQVKGRRKKK